MPAVPGQAYLGNQLIGGSATTPLYTRPTDWLTLPTLTAGQERVVGLVAVWDLSSNHVAMICQGAYTVDWGDGNVENFATGVKAEHNYSYAALSAGTLTSRGFRQAIVSVTPQAGNNLTKIDLNQRHSALTQTWVPTPWLDVKGVGANLSTLTIGGASAANTHRYLEQFEWVGPTALTTTASAFYGCAALRKVVGTQWTAGVTNVSSMFANCGRLVDVATLNTSLTTNFNALFWNCQSLTTVPTLDTSKGTNFSTMFSGCTRLRSVWSPIVVAPSGTIMVNNMFTGCADLVTAPSIDTSRSTTFGSMFDGCARLQSVPTYDTSLGTIFSSMFRNCEDLIVAPPLNFNSATAVDSLFQGCSSLKVVPAFNFAAATNVTNVMTSITAAGRIRAIGFTRGGITLNSGIFGAAELDEFYGNLGTASGAQTITVTGNWGTAADNPAIATAKGWTITGS